MKTLKRECLRFALGSGELGACAVGGRRGACAGDGELGTSGPRLPGGGGGPGTGGPPLPDLDAELLVKTARMDKKKAPVMPRREN